MNIAGLMTPRVRSCRIGENLQQAAQIMWDGDCGVVPIVDDDERVVGMLTDRDISMAACMQGKALWAIPVSHAMSRQVYGVGEADSIETAEAVMRRAKVRRVPVLDGYGKLKGVLSITDLARHAEQSSGRKSDGLSCVHGVRTIAAICEGSHAPGRASVAAEASAPRPGPNPGGDGHAGRKARGRRAVPVPPTAALDPRR